MRTAISLMLILSVFVISCKKKKYPDGGSYSLASKKGRMENSWHFSTVVWDTADYTDKYLAKYKDYVMVINRDGTYGSMYKNTSGNEVIDGGRWQFSGDKKRVIFASSMAGGSFEWTILKLRQKELWVTGSNYDGTKVEIHFVPPVK